MDFTAEWSRHGAGTLGLYEPQGSRPYAATTAGTKYPNDYAPPDTRAAISELPVPVPVARAGRDPGAGGHAVHPTTFLGASYASPAAEAAKAYSWWQDRFGWALTEEDKALVREAFSDGLPRLMVAAYGDGK